MADLFRGWRPKLGLCALLFALLTTAAWVRSLDQYDLFSLVTSTTSIQVLESHEGRFYWTRFEKQYPAPIWSRFSTSVRGLSFLGPFFRLTYGDTKPSLVSTSCGRTCPFPCSSLSSVVFGQNPRHELVFSLWSFSYSMFCVPSTTVAASLLLWPRSKARRAASLNP